MDSYQIRNLFINKLSIISRCYNLISVKYIEIIK